MTYWIPGSAFLRPCDLAAMEVGQVADVACARGGDPGFDGRAGLLRVLTQSKKFSMWVMVPSR